MTRIGILFLLATSAWPAHSQDLPALKSDSETCVCTDSNCNNACIRKAEPGSHRRPAQAVP